MPAINEVTDLTLDGDVAVITLDSPPVNALSFNVRDGLFEGFKAAIADPAAAAIVLICAGRTFIAGADISEFGGASKGASLFEVQAMMESSPKPVVAAIHGTALGGGLEVALCAHYRIAVPSAALRAARGEPRAAARRRRDPAPAPHRRTAEGARDDDVRHPRPGGGVPRHGSGGRAGRRGRAAGPMPSPTPGASPPTGAPLAKISDRPVAPMSADEFAAFRAANARRFRGFKAPEAIIQTVEAAVSLPFAEGMDVERRLFTGLVTSPESAAQRYVFFAEREVWKVPDVPADTPTIPVASVGIIGAGTMGGGIAMNFANAGVPVTIVETQQEALDRGLAVVRANYERSARNGRFPMEDVDRRMGLITGSLSLDDLAAADLVIEAVFERMDVKKDVFTQLDAIAKPGAVLATNTIGLNIDEIASVTKRPEAVIGMHFFSPANVMRLVEVVRADHTSKEVINTSMQIARTIGKIAALVGVCPGFVGNRMLAQRGREAQALLDEGAMPWDVDRVLYDFGFAMGPFQMIDLAGLDIGWVKERSTGATIRDRLCEVDRRGQKTGAGYYDYDANRNASPSPVTEELVREFAARSGKEPRTFTDAEMVERMIYPMINEGAKILEEGKAIRASDIDVIWINGYNWPAYRGGPMFYADQIGLDKIVGRLRELEATAGPQWAPAPLLERLAADGKSFAGWRAG